MTDMLALSHRELGALVVAVCFAASLNVYATVVRSDCSRGQPESLALIESWWVIGMCAAIWLIVSLRIRRRAWTGVERAADVRARPAAGLIATPPPNRSHPPRRSWPRRPGSLIALAAHGNKLAMRTTVTASPEPFSNIAQPRRERDRNRTDVVRDAPSVRRVRSRSPSSWQSCSCGDLAGLRRLVAQAHLPRRERSQVLECTGAPSGDAVSVIRTNFVCTGANVMIVVAPLPCPSAALVTTRRPSNFDLVGARINHRRGRLHWRIVGCRGRRHVTCRGRGICARATATRAAGAAASTAAAATAASATAAARRELDLGQRRRRGHLDLESHAGVLRRARVPSGQAECVPGVRGVVTCRHLPGVIDEHRRERRGQLIDCPLLRPAGRR